MKTKARHMIVPGKSAGRAVKALIAVCLTLVLISGIVIGAVTLLKDTSGTVNEELTVATVTCSVNDDYSVTNTGNIPALIRVRVIVNKTDSGDIIPGDTPDYTDASDWTRIGEYLYYNAIVSAEDGENATTVPISFSDPLDDDIQVCVLAEAIQAAADADDDSWGVSFSDGSWS